MSLPNVGYSRGAAPEITDKKAMSRTAHRRFRSDSRSLIFIIVGTLLLVASSACTRDEYPQTLSGWNQLRIEHGELVVAQDVEPFTINSPLFSDYAVKLRTRQIPGELMVEGDWYEYPVGSIFTKTFYYPSISTGLTRHSNHSTHASVTLNDHRLLETRVLYKEESGWIALPYLWNEAETEAVLAPTGGSVKLTLDGETFDYFVPDQNQCASCHAWNHSTGEIRPLGAKPAQFSSLPAWQNDTVEVEARARAYLDVSCAHCHNADGAADTSGLDLEYANNHPTSLGICKPAVAAGPGAPYAFDIKPGRPEVSNMMVRLGSQNPAVMMPEIGRSLVHVEGHDLISAWITSMDGECETTQTRL